MKKNDQISNGQADVSLIDDSQWLNISRRYNLTPRELQVAKLVCDGLNNEQISNVLNIKTGTVKTHTRNIYRRVNVQNRIGILLQFLRYLYSSAGYQLKTRPQVVEFDDVGNVQPRDITQIPDNRLY